MFELKDTIDHQAIITVVGVGGGGCNAVKHMELSGNNGINFVYANTDIQHLINIDVTATSKTLQLGSDLTKGLGAGADPAIGKQAAIESRDQIESSIANSDMVFVVAGLGGGTGTGAAPVVAQIARDIGALTIAVVTRPFKFEGPRRDKLAEQGIEHLKESVDSVITISNEEILKKMGEDASLEKAFAMADDVLSNTVQGISDLIITPGLINVDFADVKTIMSGMGQSMIGIASARGATRAAVAARNALNSLLLEDSNVKGAKGFLVNITAGPDLSIGEFGEVGGLIRDMASQNATVVIGTSINVNMEDELRVTLVATGISLKSQDYGQTLSSQDLDSLESKGLIDVPTFLRRQADPEPTNLNEIRLNIVAQNDISEKSIASVLELLSLIYEAPSGDRLTIRDITFSPTGGRKEKNINQGSAIEQIARLAGNG